MALPQSLFEALVSGYAGRRQSSRALFTFVIDHSTSMDQPFEGESQSKHSSVINALNQMCREMAAVDRNSQLDIAAIGYPLANGTGPVADITAAPVGAGWNKVCNTPRFASGKRLDTSSEEAMFAALKKATEVCERWRNENKDPLLSPIILHLTSIDRPSVSGFPEAVTNVKSSANAVFFSGFFSDSHFTNVEIPDAAPASGGLAAQSFDEASVMPELVEDVGNLLKGMVTPRIRTLAGELAEGFGLPRGFGAIAAGMAADALGGGGALGVGAAIDGLEINSNRGFAIIKGRIGFRIFYRMFN